MATVLGANVKILIDEFDLSGQNNSLQAVLNVPEMDVTAMQDTGVMSEPGVPANTLSHKGYFTGIGAGLMEQELKARLGSGSAVHLGVLLDTANAPAVSYMSRRAWGQQLTVDAPVKELITLAGKWPAALNMERGFCVFDGTLTATGAQEAIDLGAAGAAGGIAYVFVQAVTGSGSATLKVRSSSTQAGTYVDEATFTVTAVGAQRAVITGAVARWLRLECTGLTGITALRVVVLAGVKGVTY